jgi:hypothetical protein
MSRPIVPAPPAAVLIAALVIAPLLAAPHVAHAQTSDSPFEYHAALDIGAGLANNLPILGIPSYGTFDYRNAAVQIRYRLDDNDQFVVQFLNRRIGTSPLQEALPDVALQWAYWQHRGDWGTLKLGRAPMPRGICNEIRFVGTVLPFFRPSFEIYGEGRETVDGAVYTQNFRAENGVALQVNAFLGSNEVRTQVMTTAGNSIRAFRGNVLKGGQLWLSVPQGDTRVGGHFAHHRNDQPTTFGKRHEMLASVESHPLPRTTLRADGLRIYGTGPNQDRRSGSVSGVFNLAERLDVMSEFSTTQNRAFQAAPASNVDVIAVRDHACGFTYRIGGGALVRLERHEVSGYAFDAWWQQQIFGGGDTPPPTKASDAEIVAFVKATPGAIGYVSPSADVSGVTVVALK